MKIARKFNLPLAMLLAAAALAPGCGRGGREEREFSALEKDFVEYYLKTNPSVATSVGEHRYDDRLEDMSVAAVEANLRTCRGYLDRLRAIDGSGLSRDRAIDARLLEQNIELILLDLEEDRAYRNNPQLYTEILANSIYGVLSQQSAPLEERLDRIANRLDEFPRFVAQAIANLDNPPKIRTEVAIDVTRGLIAFLEGDVLREAAQGKRMQDRVKGSFVPAREALARFQSFLENDLLNRSFGDVRIGEESFRRRFELSLGTDMTPEMMVDAAYRELDAVHERMFALAAPIYEEMTGEAIPEETDYEERNRIVAAVLADIADDHPEPRGLLDACRAAYAEAEGFVRQRDLVALPESPLIIDTAPPFLRVTQIAASIAPGAFDPDGRYYFMVSPVPDYLSPEQAELFMREYNSEMIRIVTIHEAMPGHFVQLARAARSASPVRSAFSSPALCEGWAVYAQGLMVEEGFRGGGRFALVADKYYLRVIVNALLDSGMHREGMQEDEAVRLSVQEAFQDGSDALAKWRRRVGIYPSYLSSYFVGALEIRSIREDASRAWGERFSLKDFHERLLACGSIPPKYAREIVLGPGEATASPGALSGR